MPKVTRIGTPAQDREDMSLLSLLSVICARNGHTFSWYTSKKQRVWLTLKGFRPIQYSTSVEIVATVTDQQMFDAIKVLFAAHFPKLMQEVPPLPTWIPAREIDTRLDDANDLVTTLWSRWQAGEVFWQDDIDINQDNAMSPGNKDGAGDELES